MTDIVKYHNSLLHAGLSTFDSSTANSLLTQLAVVLCDGYNACTVSSITRSGSTVTVTTTGAHNYLDGQVVLVSGCTQTEYNGEFRISVALGATTTFTYTCTGTPATPATGTPVIKIAPLGWTKVYSPSNKLVIKSPNVAASDYSIRFEEPTTLSVPFNTAGQPLVSPVTGCKAVSVKLYEGSMLDVDTGTLAASRFIEKSSSAVSWATQPFMVMGDDRGFWLFIPCNQAYVTTAQTYWRGFYFGDVIPLPGVVDPYRCVISGRLGFTASTDLPYAAYIPGYSVSFYGTAVINATLSFGRLLDGTLIGAQGYVHGMNLGYLTGNSAIEEFGYGTQPMNGPDPSSYAWPIYSFTPFTQANTITIHQRGKMPGMYNLGWYGPSILGFDQVTGFIATGDSVARDMVIVKDTNSTASGALAYAIDIIGPWGR